jgi:hypothetical protein
LGINNQLGPLEFAAQADIVAIELLDLSRLGLWLGAPFLRGECCQLGFAHLLLPARQHRGIKSLATQERAELSVRLAALRLCQQTTLLTAGKPPTARDRLDLRVRRRRARGRLYSRPSGSFHDVLDGERTRTFMHER